MQKKSKHILASIIFFFGIFIGLALALVLIWEHYEAVSYFFDGLTYPAYGGLRCPILMTRTETGIVRAVFNNSSNQDDEPYYRMEIGETLFPQTFDGHFVLSPHTSKSLQWTVGVNDITLGYFIFAKLDILPNADHPSREDSCGIIVLNISGLNGNQIFWFMLVLSLIALFSGFALWTTTNDLLADKALEHQRAMQALVILVPLTLLAGFMGWWFTGLVLCALVFLLMAVMWRYVQ